MEKSGTHQKTQTASEKINGFNRKKLRKRPQEMRDRYQEPNVHGGRTEEESERNEIFVRGSLHDTRGDALLPRNIQAFPEGVLGQEVLKFEHGSEAVLFEFFPKQFKLTELY